MRGGNPALNTMSLVCETQGHQNNVNSNTGRIGVSGGTGSYGCNPSVTSCVGCSLNNVVNMYTKPYSDPTKAECSGKCMLPGDPAVCDAVTLCCETDPATGTALECRSGSCVDSTTTVSCVNAGVFTPTCGCTILQSGTFVLPNNMVCPENGIKIHANDVALDCNGKTITGPGPGSADGTVGSVGIAVASSNNVYIRRCTVSSFWSGIQYLSSSGNTSGNTVTGTGRYGIRYESSSGKVTENTVAGVSKYGIYFGSSTGTISSNTATGNQHAGILVAASTATVTGNTVDNNIETSGGQNDGTGIWLQASTGCTVSNNHATGNRCFGIWADSSQNNIGDCNNVLTNTKYSECNGYIEAIADKDCYYCLLNNNIQQPCSCGTSGSTCAVSGDCCTNYWCDTYHPEAGETYCCLNGEIWKGSLLGCQETNECKPPCRSDLDPSKPEWWNPVNGCWLSSPTKACCPVNYGEETTDWIETVSY